MTEDDCIFCNDKFQDEFLDRMESVEKGVQRLTYLTFVTVGLLVGLGIIEVRDMIAFSPIPADVPGIMISFLQSLGG